MTVLVIQNSPLLPTLIERAGKLAARRFLEFFTVNIRNKNTRQVSIFLYRKNLREFAKVGGDFAYIVRKSRPRRVLIAFRVMNG